MTFKSIGMFFKRLFTKTLAYPAAQAAPAKVTLTPLSKIVVASHSDLNKWSAEWTFPLYNLILLNLPTLSKASDITKIRPDYFKLIPEKQAFVILELFKAMTKYESNFNPLSSSVDVGTAGNKDTYSVGLLQVSVTDSANKKNNLNYKYEDLKDPVKNLTLAFYIMLNQIIKRGKFMIVEGESGKYWAVLNPGGKYDKSVHIINYVNSLTFDQPSVAPAPAPAPVVPVEEPWFTIALKEIGQKELYGAGKHNPRIVEYHSATSLKAKDDETAWCSSFVNWCLKKSGYKGTNSAWARNFLDYGTKLNAPKKFCVMVFERNAPGGDSHVGFWTGQQTSTHYHVLGGNQGDSVCIKLMSKKDLLGSMWPVK